MALQINKHYKLHFDIGGKLLTYHGKIISVDDSFITFTDRLGQEITFKTANLIGFLLEAGSYEA